MAQSNLRCHGRLWKALPKVLPFWWCFCSFSCFYDVYFSEKSNPAWRQTASNKTPSTPSVSSGNYSPLYFLLHHYHYLFLFLLLLFLPILLSPIHVGGSGGASGWTKSISANPVSENTVRMGTNRPSGQKKAAWRYRSSFLLLLLSPHRFLSSPLVPPLLVVNRPSN